MTSIAYVTATFPPYCGGTGNVVYHNARIAARMGYDVTVFTARQPRGSRMEFPFRVESLPARFKLGNAPFTPALPSRLTRFDLIHLHCPYIFGAELTAVASGLSRTPLVITYHHDLEASGMRGRLFGGYSLLNASITLPAATRMVATSLDYAQNSALAALAENGGVEVIPNGVDVDVFCPGSAGEIKAARRRLGLAPDDSTVLFVGAMDSAHFFKGVPVLLEAVASLENVHVVLAGDGDLRPGFEDHSRRLAPGRAHFLGEVSLESLVALYRMATVTTLPSVSRGEAFGMVLIESLACGSPVVASDLPGMRNVVTPGKDGALVPPNDPQTLARAISSIAGNPSRGAEMGAAGRAKVISSYSWDVVGDLLGSVYERALESHRAASSGDAWFNGRRA